MTAPPVKKAKLNCVSKLRFNTAEQAIANMAFSAEKWGLMWPAAMYALNAKGIT